MGEEKQEANRIGVIVVDDDLAVLGALKFALELEGFAVCGYRTGSELLGQPGFPRVACLVIDYRLREMDGLDLLAELRARGVRLPAVLITSHPPPSLRRRATAENVSIVEKPLLGNALLDAIRHALNEGASAG
jgi:FixJ family two-component response regulator